MRSNAVLCRWTLHSACALPASSRSEGPGLASRLRAPGSRIRAPGSQLRAPGSRLQAPGSGLRALGSRLLVPVFWVPDSGHTPHCHPATFSLKVWFGFCWMAWDKHVNEVHRILLSLPPISKVKWDQGPWAASSEYKSGSQRSSRGV